jgi:DNA mismatch endonuclease (patch repair protein)
MDKISPERRSENMQRIRSVGMKPEMIVRRSVYALGYRYRLHSKDLPGKPDLVFRQRRKAIFVHGCFWHQHQQCQDGRVPKSNRQYWRPKLTRNVKRDAENMAAMKAGGWRVLVVWECETKDESGLTARLKRFIGA